MTEDPFNPILEDHTYANMFSTTDSYLSPYAIHQNSAFAPDPLAIVNSSLTVPATRAVSSPSQPSRAAFTYRADPSSSALTGGSNSELFRPPLPLPLPPSTTPISGEITVGMDETQHSIPLGGFSDTLYEAAHSALLASLVAGNPEAALDPFAFVASSNSAQVVGTVSMTPANFFAGVPTTQNFDQPSRFVDSVLPITSSKLSPKSQNQPNEAESSGWDRTNVSRCSIRSVFPVFFVLNQFSTGQRGAFLISLAI